MFEDRYISDIELDLIQKKYMEKVHLFLNMRKKAQEMFYDFCIPYPYQSENNFRDSWFHYRKIYKSRSVNDLFGQTAMFDEHLQRAEKDMVVTFFTRICRRLEFWYKEANEIYKTMSERFNADQAEQIYEMEGAENWVLTFYSMLRNNSLISVLDREHEFAYSCVHIFQKYHVKDNIFYIEVQRLLHHIKKKILEVRSGGADIKRHDEPGIYFEEFTECTENLIHLYQSYNFLSLFNVTDMIISNLFHETIK